MVRSGDEPMHARSPLGLRLGLVIVGALLALAFGLRAWVNGFAPGVLAAGGIVLVALVNAWVVIRRIRSGAHYQPGRDVPPYHPMADRTIHESPAEGHPEAPDVPESVRQRRYLILMGVCLALITIAWVWVRLVSVTAAVIMSMVAMVIPPIAAVVGNAGWTGRRR